MGIVLWHVTMSLDGFIAGPGDDMDWIFEYAGPSAVVDEVIRTTGAIVAGRHTYDVGRRDAGKASGAPYGGAWSGPIFVLTHRPQVGEEDPAITFVSGDIEGVVANAMAAADGNNVEVFGADVAHQALERGLVDEILVHIAPLLLGDGVRLFGRPGAARINLEPIAVTRAEKVTDLRYRVVR
jgi:dihydrofolate reductase